MQIESVSQTKNRSEPAKNRFSVALHNNVSDTCAMIVKAAFIGYDLLKHQFLFVGYVVRVVS